MEPNKRSVNLQIEAPFYTYGNFSENTKEVWWVFHGYGQRSEYFMRRFDILPEDSCFIVAPQGLSRFYLDGGYRKVGASWMTKEFREQEIEHQFKYLEGIWEQLFSNGLGGAQLNLFGFSQGVATMGRWIARKGISFGKMIIWGGVFPSGIEIRTSTESQIHFVVGDKDHFLPPEKAEMELRRLEGIFGDSQINFHSFSGGHEVKRETIQKIASL